MLNKIILLSFFVFCSDVFGQTDSSFVEIDTAVIDSALLDSPENMLLNDGSILRFYQSLVKLEAQQDRKINIVHIGDSHIQADLMTDKIRRSLQQRFGNAGRGFVFPHTFAKTNGSSDVRFSSNANWESRRNIYAPDGSIVGLSGIALSTSSKDFAIDFRVKEPEDAFTNIRIITPKNTPDFAFSLARQTIVTQVEVPKKITHKIRSGEALSIIADKYNVSIAALKKENGLKSNAIRAGKTLRIPSRGTRPVNTERYEYTPLEICYSPHFHEYYSPTVRDQIYIVPTAEIGSKNLNGLILENDRPGILYHNIGVNGAKLSDYIKYPLFFDQLHALAPDLIIVSLGTNESFDKVSDELYKTQLAAFIESVRGTNPNAEILIMTPPPSLFQRKFENTFAAAYAKSILELASEQKFAVWDLYSQLGGLYGVERNSKRGLIGADKVHYTKMGYETQAELFVDALLKGYSAFKLTAK